MGMSPESESKTSHCELYFIATLSALEMYLVFSILNCELNVVKGKSEEDNSESINW